MTDNIIPFTFEDQAIRVILINDEPWFIANDLCAVLALANSRDALSRLDDDEKGVGSTDTLGGNQSLNIVSESGMYSLVLGSRKPEARRFKKWVTSDLLPTLRRTGRYSLTDQPRPIASADIDPPRIMAAVALANAARKLYGLATARRVWVQCGLPVAAEDAGAADRADPLSGRIADWIGDRDGFSIEECANGVGIDHPDLSMRLRIGRILRGLGFMRHTVRRGAGAVNIFVAAGA